MSGEKVRRIVEEALSGIDDIEIRSFDPYLINLTQNMDLTAFIGELVESQADLYLKISDITKLLN